MTQKEKIHALKILRLKIEPPTNNQLGWLETWIHTEDLEAFDSAIKALEQLPKLQNRCYALTHGLMCVFCPYECEHRAEIEPQESEDEE